MKRLSTYLTLLVMAALPFTFTSCEEDWYDGYDWFDKPYYDASDYALDLAQTLSGTWEGTIINEYYNEDGEREQTRCDADFTFVQYRSDAINGTGYETDYDGQGNQQTLRFKWYVDYRTGNVNIEYVSSGYRFLLDAKGNSKYSGFSLDNNYFDGVMEGVNTTSLSSSVSTASADTTLRLRPRLQTELQRQYASARARESRSPTAMCQ